MIKLIPIAIIYALVAVSLGVPDLSNDSSSYFRYGLQLLQTGVYGDTAGVPDMSREPGYGLLMAVLLAPTELLRVITGIQFSTDFLLKWVTFWQLIIAFFSFHLFAYSKIVPKKVQTPIFLLAILSPTFLSVHTVIYSETWTISLSAIFFYLVGRAMEEDKGFKFAAFAGLVWGSFILTKMAYKFTPHFFIIGGLSFFLLAYLRKEKWNFYQLLITRRLAKVMVLVALFSLVPYYAYQVRNQLQFGTTAGNARLGNAVAGKILRVASFNLPEELPQIFIASIGTNLCYRTYSKEECQKFEMLGADAIGFKTWFKYLNRYEAKEFKSVDEAFHAYLKDMFKVYMQNPFIQIFGSFVEAVRMSFFESTIRLQSGWHFIDQIIPRIWHFFGSILMWCFFAFGIVAIRRNSFNLNLKTKLFLCFPAIIILYHYLVMTQFTNLVRYVYPIIPCIYVFSAYGIAYLLNKRTVKAKA